MPVSIPPAKARQCMLHVFFFNDTATTEIYTLSLHDALPISFGSTASSPSRTGSCASTKPSRGPPRTRSEEHTSELQSLTNLVCRLLLEKKKNNESRSNTTRTRTKHRSHTSRGWSAVISLLNS